MDGLTLMSGLFNQEIGLQIVDLDGTVLNSWKVDFFEIWPDPAHIAPPSERPHNKWAFHVQGMTAFADGSVLFNVAEKGLAKMDRCGALLWTLPRMTHHAITVADDGTLWVPSRIWHETPPAHFPGMRHSFFEDTLLNISADGDVLREISLLDVLYRAGLHGLLAGTGTDTPVKGGAFGSRDPTHVNDVEVFSAVSTTAFPRVSAGDLLVSARNLDLLIAFDPATLEVKWWRTGPWLRQHDPDIQADGRISLFNNNDDDSGGHLFGGSNIMSIDVGRDQTEIVFPRKDRSIFYSELMGTHQHLPNDNILITESQAGRVFELTADGEIAWEYFNRFDVDEAALIEDAQRYDRGFFRVPSWDCAAAAAD
jgi:hypothetical protein